MQQGNEPSAATAGKSQMVSPFELAQGQPVSTGPTVDTLLGQVNSMQGTMGDLHNQLNYPNLKLKSSHKYILNNKLSDANTNLRAANNKMGAEAPAEPSLSNAQGQGPLAKFLWYLTDGQNQLIGAKKQLQDLKTKGTSLSPADMMLIQIKMNKAQQEIEFSTIMLSKAVEDFKSLMQVQL
jgi:hypothetical protein